MFKNLFRKQATYIVIILFMLLVFGGQLAFSAHTDNHVGTILYIMLSIGALLALTYTVLFGELIFGEEYCIGRKK